MALETGFCHIGTELIMEVLTHALRLGLLWCSNMESLVEIFEHEDLDIVAKFVGSFMNQLLWEIDYYKKEESKYALCIESDRSLTLAYGLSMEADKKWRRFVAFYDKKYLVECFNLCMRSLMNLKQCKVDYEAMKLFQYFKNDKTEQTFIKNI